MGASTLKRASAANSDLGRIFLRTTLIGGGETGYLTLQNKKRARRCLAEKEQLSARLFRATS